jgi:hypothetical protein
VPKQAAIYAKVRNFFLVSETRWPHGSNYSPPPSQPVPPYAIETWSVDHDRNARRQGPIRSRSCAARLASFGLALQLRFLTVSESMGNHDSKIVDAGGVD